MIANLNVIILNSNYALLAIIVFTSAILGTYNYISIPVAVAAIQAMNLIKFSSRQFPFFIGLLIEFLVAMKRIQNFML
jgi:hypothetical protein